MSVLNNTTVNGVVTQTQPATAANHLVRLGEAQTLVASLYQGTWNGTTTFTAGKFVTRNGSLYVANQTSTSQAPESNPAVWAVAAAAGQDGASAYLYVAYASDTSGTGFSLSPGPGLNYVAFLSTNAVIASPAASNFAGLWTQYVGPSGTNGTNGTNAYTYVAFASDTSGTGFSLTPGAGLNYVAFLSTNTALGSPSAANFAGLWTQYVGPNGTNGTNGTNGANAYLYVAYASDTSGTGFSLVPGAGLNYVAFLATNTVIGSPSAGNFTGLWKQFVGAAGAAGAAGASAYVYVGYASDTSGTGFSLTWSSGLNYVAFLATNTALTPPVAANFAGLWVPFTGPAGSNGSNGTNGTNGVNAYVYVGYASDTSGTGFSLTPGAGLNYVAFLSTNTAIGTPVASNFAGLWKNYGGSGFTVSGPVTYSGGVLGLNASSAATANYLMQRDSSGNCAANQLSVTTLAVGSGTITYNGTTSSVQVNGTLTVSALTIGSFAGVLKAASGVVAGSATTDDLTEGTTNQYHTSARVLATTLTGLSSTHVLLTSDTILSAFGKLDNVLGGNYPAGSISGNLSITGTLTVSGVTTLATSLGGVLKATSGVVAGSATTDDLTEGTTNVYWTQTRFNTAITAIKNVASGLCPLDSSGKVPLTNLYAYGATPYGAASQSAMLALSASKQGDFCMRSDTNITYVLSNSSPGLLGSWVAMTYPVMSVNGATGAVVLTTDNISVGTTNLYWTQTLFNTAIAAVRGAASGVCPLDSNSLVPAANLPPVGNSVWIVNSQSTQVNLTTALKGDLANRTDQNLTYILSNNTPTSFSSWVPLLYPVASVNGQTGTIVLTTDNVAEGSTNQYHTSARVLATVLTGFTAGAGTVTATDTVLSALQKVAANTTGQLALSGGTLTGMLNFSGTANPGLVVNQLTTTQINALAATSGYYGNIVYDTALNQLKALIGGSWVSLAAGAALPLGGGTLTGTLTFQDGLATNIAFGTTFSCRTSNSDNNFDILQSSTVVLTLDAGTNDVLAPHGYFDTGSSGGYKVNGQVVIALSSSLVQVQYGGNWMHTAASGYASMTLAYNGSAVLSTDQSGNTTTTGTMTATGYKVGSTQVVGNQQGAIADDSSGAANQSTVNAILAAMRAHGLIST